MAVPQDRAVRSESSLPPQARNRLAGLLLLGAGAILLIVSLFLDWFEPGHSAWTVFEVWDIVLAALTLAALAAVAGALDIVPPRHESWALAPAIIAPVVVVVSLLNHPPAAQGAGQDPMIGIWLALAGSLLMLIGAVLAVARISVAIAEHTTLAAPPAGRPGGGRRGRGRHGMAEPLPGEAPGAPPVAGEPSASAGPPGSPTAPTRRAVP